MSIRMCNKQVCQSPQQMAKRPEKITISSTWQSNFKC